MFIPYRSTPQADDVKLVTKKLHRFLVVEGELPEDGLVAYADCGDDLMMALAMQIVSGEQDEAETVEEVSATARDFETEAEELLVCEGGRGRTGSSNPPAKGRSQLRIPHTLGTKRHPTP